MKVFLIIVLFTLFLICGILIYFYYRIRYKLFYDLIFINKYIANNINFNKEDINKILTRAFDDISFTSRYLLKNRNYINNYILKKSENEIIDLFFSSLGKGDVDYEIHNLEYYKNIFESIESSAKDDVNKKGKLYFKLLIGAGLIVCIILV